MVDGGRPEYTGGEERGDEAGPDDSIEGAGPTAAGPAEAQVAQGYKQGIGQLKAES